MAARAALRVDRSWGLVVGTGDGRVFYGWYGEVVLDFSMIGILNAEMNLAFKPMME